MLRQELQDELNLIIALWVAEDAKGVLERETVYNWEDYNFTVHIKGQVETRWREYAAPCAVVLPENPVYEEAYIGEFNGTGCESSSELMLTIAGVSCSCGEYKNMKIRREGSTSIILAELMNKPIPSKY